MNDHRQILKFNLEYDLPLAYRINKMIVETL